MTTKNRYAFFKGCVIPTRLPFLEKTAKQVFQQMGVELVDFEEFSCCPEPVWFKSAKRLTWLTIAARNLCVAEKNNLDIISLCNGCTSTLTEANHELKGDRETMERVNGILKQVGDYGFKGTIEVLNHIKVLNEMRERIAGEVKRRLDGLKVVTHPGCHLVSPSDVMRFDDVEEPRILDELVSLTGAEPLDYQEKRTCCAPGISALSFDDSLAVVKRKVESAGDADCLVLCCPQCFQQFDVGQMMLARKQGLARKLPVINYVQLLGLAFGYSLDDVGYRFHKTRDENFEKKLANAASMAS